MVNYQIRQKEKNSFNVNSCKKRAGRGKITTHILTIISPAVIAFGEKNTLIVRMHSDSSDSSDSCDNNESRDSSDSSDTNCDKTQQIKLWWNLKT